MLSFRQMWTIVAYLSLPADARLESLCFLEIKTPSVLFYFHLECIIISLHISTVYFFGQRSFNQPV